MASVYILFSIKINKFYIGSCADLDQRLLDHKNKTYVKSFTADADDWDIYFSINELDETLARKIEKHIKSMKSKKYIENIKVHPEIIVKLVSKYSNS